MEPLKTKKVSFKKSFPNLMKIIFGNKSKVLIWGIIWLVILSSTVLINIIFSEYIWEKDLKNIILSCDILRDNKSKKKEVINIPSGNEINLQEISEYLDKELEDGRGLAKFSQHFEQGDILSYKYQEQGNSNWLRHLILLFPPLLLVGASNILRKNWKKSIYLLDIDPIWVQMLNDFNEWFETFGLSKISKAKTKRLHYYHTLEIMAAGYKEIHGTAEQDKIFLFWMGNLSQIKYLATEHKNKAELKKLFTLLNNLAEEDPKGEKQTKYQIKRGLICTREDFDRGITEAQDWHEKEYPNIKNVFIDIEQESILECVKDLNNECDFAVFENAHGEKLLFVGFYRGCTTFVLQDRLDKLGDRQELFTLSKDYFQ